jgi:arginyl-tRNA--protein-N-Asp/Glu arginylyltransferase
MKLTRKEFGHDYTQYRFGYCEYATRESGDNIAVLYASGFLPYSADPNVRDVFYMARSARIPLTGHMFSSENRRIARRFDGQFSMRSLTLNEAKEDDRIRSLFLEYFALRHGEHIMPAARFDAILSSDLPMRVLVYEKEGALLAVVLEIIDGTFRHFWYSAYDLTYTNQSLGMWLILDALRLAKEDKCSHYYIGTVYGEKALYKTNVEPLEFWDGSEWSTDLTLLKTLARSESK